MSHNYCILKSLNLKDNNITFDQEFVTNEVIRGVSSLVYHAKLTYIPHRCDKCGCYILIITNLKNMALNLLLLPYLKSLI